MWNTNVTNGVCARSCVNENKKDEEHNEGNSNDNIGAVQQKENVQSVTTSTMENSQQDVITNGESLDEQNSLINTSQNESNVESVNAVDTNTILNTMMVQNNILMELLKLQQNKPLKAQRYNHCSRFK